MMSSYRRVPVREPRLPDDRRERAYDPEEGERVARRRELHERIWRRADEICAETGWPRWRCEQEAAQEFNRANGRRRNLDPSGFGYFAAGAVVGALALHGSQRAASGPRPLDYSYEGWQASFPGSEIPGSPAQKALKAFWKYWQAHGEQVAGLDAAIQSAAFNLGYEGKKLTSVPSLTTIAQHLNVDLQARWEDGEREGAAEPPLDWKDYKAMKSRTNGRRHKHEVYRVFAVGAPKRAPKGLNWRLDVCRCGAERLVGDAGGDIVQVEAWKTRSAPRKNLPSGFKDRLASESQPDDRWCDECDQEITGEGNPWCATCYSGDPDQVQARLHKDGSPTYVAVPSKTAGVWEIYFDSGEAWDPKPPVGQIRQRPGLPMYDHPLSGPPHPSAPIFEVYSAEGRYLGVDSQGFEPRSLDAALRLFDERQKRDAKLRAWDRAHPHLRPNGERPMSAQLQKIVADVHAAITALEAFGDWRAAGGTAARERFGAPALNAHAVAEACRRAHDAASKIVGTKLAAPLRASEKEATALRDAIDKAIADARRAKEAEDPQVLLRRRDAEEAHRRWMSRPADAPTERRGAPGPWRSGDWNDE